MTLSTTRAPATRVRRLTATLYGYSFLDEFVLLYPVYTLLFSDTGLSVWQISSLFVLWSATGVVLEVPSGAWADAVSRRLLLWLGPLLAAVGFALWVLVPSYWAFAVGFVLWGARGAFVSGALEALVYEELERLGVAERYARLMGRSRALGLVAVMAAMGLAGPVLAWGGYPAVGAASVLVCVASAATAGAFPEQRPVAGHDDGSGAATRWAGLVEARREPSVRGAILLVPAVTAVWGALDEYTPLLVRETGVPDARVPYLLLLIWAGATAGSLLAGRFERLGTGGLAWLLGVAAVALAVGAAARTPLALGLVAVAFGGFQLATVLADVRLQQRIDDTGRATLTSVAGLGTELVTVAVYAGYAAVATRSAHSTAFVVSALPYLLTALALGVRARATARNESPPEGRCTQ
ncbi:MFS transporter [Streptomyces sp. SLBN-31]|jgi:MFS family permease|uniref:MFS transporter n=1 Tax=Streptomyces sp. SLBN-31 TaxID=2768444 RepID=UPI0011709A23|nr:MFS transporter [Streptomyces sp. SLBN-31]TQJ86717.1 putative MFS family arabinose efflux permease [Streptomyces sp. SLBN-31]